MFDDSYVEINGWLVWEDLLLNADDWSVHRVVNVWQVGLCWTLSNSTELIVDGTVTEANPTLVGTEIWNWNATEMGANSRAHKNLGVTGIGKSGNGFFIEEGSGWQTVGFLDFRDGKSSDENKFTIPGGLENLTGWELRDIKLLVGVSDISGTGDHLIIDGHKDSLDTNDVR